MKKVKADSNQIMASEQDPTPSSLASSSSDASLAGMETDSPAPQLAYASTRGDVSSLLFASTQLLELYVQSKTEGVPFNSQRETILWQLLLANRALFSAPSPSSFLLSSTSPFPPDEEEQIATRLSDYAFFLHAVVNVGDRSAALSDDKMDAFEEAWREFLPLFRETSGGLGMNDSARHDGLLNLLSDICTQVSFLLRRPFVSNSFAGH